MFNDVKVIILLAFDCTGGLRVPRIADAGLEKRILDAGYLLWSEGGEKALTMRGVALAAGTTTPTVYERFRDKRELINFLRDRARLKMVSAIKSARTPAEACERALDFTLHCGNEYKLITIDWAARLGRKEPLPSFAFMKERLAEYLGGKQEDHNRLALSLVSQIHGAATLVLGKETPAHVAREIRGACLDACGTLIGCARKRKLH
jgi:AcrR family transcriptional regulator